MKKILLTFCILLVSFVSFSENDKEKTPKSGSIYPVITEIDPSVQSLIGKVNTDSLMATIQHLQDYGTRAYFKPQAYEAQDWLKAKFEAMGLDVELQYFSTAGNNFGTPDTSSANVIAIQRGTKYPDEYIVCGGHYDSGPVRICPSWNLDWDNCPGADDNASGISGILETARILSQFEFERSIIYCCFSGDEPGGYGSGAYATRCRLEGMNIVGFFALDMIGYLAPENEIQINLFYWSVARTFANYCINIYDLYFPKIPVKRTIHNVAGETDGMFILNGYKAVFPFEFVQCPSIHGYDCNEDIIGVSVNSPEQATMFTQANVASIATIAKYDVAMPPQPLDADPPTNCVAQHLQGRSIKISWEYPEENTPKQYFIYRDGVKIKEIITSPYTETLSINDYDLHCYKVTADYWEIESEPSNESCVSVPNSVTGSNVDFKIYPNPTTGDLIIERGELRIINMEILDMNGKNVFYIMSSNPSGTVINISHLPAGFYFLKIQTESGEVVKKVLKE